MQQEPMQEISAPKYLKISISENGKTVWVNTAERCIFRACRIGHLSLEDDRKRKTKSGLTKEFDEKLNAAQVLMNMDDDSLAMILKSLLEHHYKTKVQGNTIGSLATMGEAQKYLFGLYKYGEEK